LVTQYILVMVTAPSAELGQQIADLLIDKKLAACVNMISPIKSSYMWQGESFEDDEVLLLVKTQSALFESDLVPAIRSIHPYEVPEIIALPIIMGSKGYLDWIGEMTQQ
jgi:periplasmic divalent cation tolerance protein